MKIEEIINKIQTKKFKNLDEKIITEKINEFLVKNNKIKINQLTDKSSDFKRIIKYVKQEMHRSYGAFQNDIAKREKLLEELRKDSNNEEIKNNILMTHSSTRERLESYKYLKRQFSEFIEGKSIFDLGAGLNPLEFDENKIIAVEFNKNDVDFLNEYFKIINKSKENNNQSKAILIDLKKDYSKLKDIKVDTVFAWKLFDLLDFKTTEEIIKNLNASTIIASFSTKTLGNRLMHSPRRAGFQKMLRRLGLSYTTLSIENEIFYLIKLTIN